MTTERPALFPSAFHPHKGGVEELTRQLALEQLRRARAPLVATMREPKSLPRLEVIGGIETRRYRFRVPEPRPRFLLGWAAFAALTRHQVAHDLKSHRCDLVHIQCVSSNARYALHAARTLDVPLVVSLQGELTMDATGLYQRSAQMRRSWRRLIDAADAITACSQYVLDEAEAFYGESFGTRGTVVYNGIDSGECRSATPETREKPYVLGLGRLVIQKGYDLLVEAFAALSTRYPQHELIVAGSGPELPSLRAQASDRGVADRVHFLGAVPHDRALRLFAGADAFVLASRHEPQGIVVLEAMATGTTVVAAAVGGVPEVVTHGENGLLFAGGDAQDLAKVLEGALAAEHGDLRAAAAETAAQFDWRHQVDAYDLVYSAARG